MALCRSRLDRVQRDAKYRQTVAVVINWTDVLSAALFRADGEATPVLLIQLEHMTCK
uniref:Uncharacterized protein n=1 Tax=Peronospora matthiolae TaxID=2874970 RepID=A0AAV1VG44_9STRA